MKKLAIFLILCTNFMGCDNYKQTKRNIKNASTVTLYSIYPTPTEPAAQLEEKLYLLDYEVIDTLTVNDKQVDALKEALLNKENFTEENNKRCPFMGKYGITFDHRVQVVLSTSPCGKLQMKRMKSDTLYAYDLVNENDNEKVLQHIKK